MAKYKKSPAPVPPARNLTVRNDIAAFIREGPASARDISMAASVPEKLVYEHLEHIRLSFKKTTSSFLVTPARCNSCGFVFTKRERLRGPGRCPICRSAAIEEPLFAIKDGGG